MATPDQPRGRGGRSTLPLFATTRGKLLAALCRGRCTVEELARRLSVTPSGVRAQVERLERDGLVRRAGSRRGVRRPHADYELTPKGRAVFPRGYEAVLARLVDVLTDRLPAGELRAVFVDAGERVLRERLGEIHGRSPRQRLREIVKNAGPFAAALEVEQRPGSTVIRACSCPLASVTASHPELCGLVAGLMGKLVAGNVREACERDGWPRCRFEIDH